MLTIENLHVSYGHIDALKGISLEVPEKSIISIIGSNGAGKSTLLNAISGLVPFKQGTIRFQGETLPKEPYKIVHKGIIQVPEGRKIFPGLTVRENLIMGGYSLSSNRLLKERILKMFELFPRLEERKDQQGGTLSGGEQQMLAICRGLMANPKVLLLDEPSLGLAPLLVNEIFQLILKIRSMGVTILLVEQNARKALSICDKAYVLETGTITFQGTGEELLCNEQISEAYLGKKVEVPEV
ncbi:MAG: ABC transporter ATP-binding protein [Spirochaetales bacterium]